jgi:hypothetical protein
LTGLRYDGPEDTGSEAGLLREALEDVYIDVMLETQPEERIHTFKVTANSASPNLSIENYNEYLKFALTTDENITFTGAGAGATKPFANEVNPSGLITVTDVGGATTYVEGTDYFIDRNTANQPQTITNLGAGIGANDTVEVTYFNASPKLLINDDILVPPFLKIRHIVYRQSTASSYPLIFVSTNELLEYRRGFESTGYTRMYSIRGQGIVSLWPRPSLDDEIEITYVPLPPKLDEIDNRPAGWDNAIWDLSEWDDVRGVESTPSLVPIQFHWNTLLPGVVVQAFDKDQRTSDVQFWQTRYEAGLAKMHLWLATYGNVEAAPVFDSVSPRFNQWPDQYSRAGWGR